MDFITLESHPALRWQSELRSSGGADPPPEILFQIFDELETTCSPLFFRKTLLDLASVSRAWIAVARTILYRAVYLVDPDSIPLFIRTVQTNRALAALVQSLVLNETFESHDGEEREDGAASSSLLSIMDCCPNIEGLVLDPSFALQRAISVPSIRGDLLSRIKELQVMESTPSHWIVPAMASGALVFPNLEFLHVKLNISGQLTTWSPLPRLTELEVGMLSPQLTTSFRSLIMSAASSLQRLEITRVVETIHDIKWPLLPRLMTLQVLGQIGPSWFFDPSLMMEATADTLDTLELSFLDLAGDIKCPRMSRLKTLRLRGCNGRPLGRAVAALIGSAPNTLRTFVLADPMHALMHGDLSTILRAG